MGFYNKVRPWQLLRWGWLRHFTCNFWSKVPQVISPRRGLSASVTTIVAISEGFPEEKIKARTS